MPSNLIMNKKKISFIIASLNSGGAERVVSTLSNKLTKKYEVHIILLTKSEPFYKLNTNVKLFYCREQPQPSNNIFQALKGNYLLYKTISTYLKKEKIKIAIGFMPTSNILAILASQKNNIPCIISERNFPLKSNITLMWRLLRKVLYKKSNFLVVQTDEIKNIFAPIIKKEKIVIINNPISPELTNARDFNFKKENIILNIGRLTNQKAQDLLIKAFSKIDNAGWKLFIVGNGEKMKEYKNLIKTLNLENKVFLIGQTKEITYYYNISKIFAFTSIFEGFPNALTEAMHFGLPCISTDCPTGPAKLITNGENGYLIPIGNQKELEHYLSKLINNAQSRNQLGKNALNSINSFDADVVVSKWVDLFNKINI